MGEARSDGTHLSDIRPLSPEMRKRVGGHPRAGAKRGRPRKDAESRSRIVPISWNPNCWTEVDRFTKANGITRSRLVPKAYG